jgi:(R,R)-butanediol dehydrogenase/meso-butanediol dehydrogenase/diacetyl reductase
MIIDSRNWESEPQEKTMRAARFHNPEDIRIEEIEEMPVSETDVRIEIEACGICGSDLHEYRHGPDLTPSEPHPKTDQAVPIPTGHEFSGRVSEVGAAVERIGEGDAVTVEPNIPCHECRYCEDGKAHLCPNTTAVGWNTGAGGFAENAVVPEQQVHVLPESIPIEDGALVEPLAVGLHAVRQSGMQAGDTVAMFGCGPIGLTVIRAAKAAGAQRIFASEPNDMRRETALDIGADDTIDPLETDAVEYIKSETSDGVDVAFEFAGLDATFNAAINSTVRDGTVTVGGLSNSETSIHLNDIVTTERTVIGTNCYGFPPQSFRSEFDAIIQSLANGEIDTEPFVTGRIELEEITESGFDALLNPETDHVKVLVRP